MAFTAKHFTHLQFCQRHAALLEELLRIQHQPPPQTMHGELQLNQHMVIAFYSKKLYCLHKNKLQAPFDPVLFQ